MDNVALDLRANDTRVFLFHSPSAAKDPSAALDAVNQWLSKDRSASPYANLRVRDIRVVSDGADGVYTTIVCSLGHDESVVQAVEDIVESAV